MLTWSEIENRALAFQKRWRDCAGDERQDSQTFEKDFMEVFGVDWREGLHEHQINLRDGSIGYIDYLLPGKILMEIKSKGHSLARAYTQAMSYVQNLPPQDQPDLVMVSDFDRIEVFNLRKEHPYKPFRVSQLRHHLRIFSLLTGREADVEARTEIEVNTDASYKMARIYEAIKEFGFSEHELKIFLVRLLFCLFADDAGIFEKDIFTKYVEESRPDGSDLSMRLMMLFSILDTPPEKRMKNLSTELNHFRYINGDIFKDPLPPVSFDAATRKLLIECARDFDWTQISPSIFGAMFQGVLNPEERRALGAHYTSEQNILKVIRPLFLDDLEKEFEQSRNTTAELRAFQQKLATLKFLDPACGCGNFLIVAYKELRRLEFEVLKLLHDNLQLQIVGVRDLIKVRPDQFYGIEIEEFPCQIARVSMVLMKHLLDEEASEYFGQNLIDFPIQANASIVNANALRIDWNDVVPASDLDYIMGNPPFVGYSNQSTEQKNEILSTYIEENGKPYKTAGAIDYVAAWYFKACTYMEQYPIEVAYVSTNSICQGEQVAEVWSPLFDRFKITINFAWLTFKWSNEAKGKAAVHCVIVGFGLKSREEKIIFSSQGLPQSVRQINPYLVEAPNVLIKSRTQPIFPVSPMIYGSKPADGGALFLSPEEKFELVRQFPEANGLVFPFLGAREFIQRIPRFCLWLHNVSPASYSKILPIMQRIKQVREFRLASEKAKTRDDACIPMLFQEIRQPETEYVLVPRVSSENRKYIPMGFMSANVVCGDQNLMIPDASLYEFGVLTSSAHVGWMRVVAGRLKSDYRYSAQIVYNNFPWPDPTITQKAKIEQTAQAILNAREQFPEASLADLYDELTMPIELRKAHKDNDKAVWEAYGKAWPLDDEPACVAHLMRLYQQLTADETPKEKKIK